MRKVEGRRSLQKRGVAFQQSCASRSGCVSEDASGRQPRPGITDWHYAQHCPSATALSPGPPFLFSIFCFYFILCLGAALLKIATNSIGSLNANGPELRVAYTERKSPREILLCWQSWSPYLCLGSLKYLASKFLGPLGLPI